MMSQTTETSLLAAQIVKQAAARGSPIVTAESCTGGMVAAALTEIPGSSAAFERGLVTYSNAAKRELLGVLASTLDQHGAVSSQTAAQMVAGALAHTPSASLAVAITGVAGPSGGSAEKPVGLVHFACQHRDSNARLAEKIFPGDRSAIRVQAALFALKMLAEMLETGD